MIKLSYIHQNKAVFIMVLSVQIYQKENYRKDVMFIDIQHSDGFVARELQVKELTVDGTPFGH